MVIIMAHGKLWKNFIKAKSKQLVFVTFHQKDSWIFI